MRLFNRSLYQTARFALICIIYMSSFLSAQEQTPQQVLDWQQAAEQCIEQKDFDCAARQYEMILSTFPDTPYALNAHVEIIKIRIEKGDLADAQSRIEVLFADYSDLPDEFTRSIYPILNRYLYRKDYARVMEIGNRALQLYPEHGNAFSTRTVMAEALVRMKQTEQADSLVEDMFALYRDRQDFVPFMHTVKSAYWKAGQREKSQVLCRRLLAEFPQNPLATRILGDWICGALVMEQTEGVEAAIETLFTQYTDPANDFLSVVARMQERYLAVNDFSRVIDIGSRAFQRYPDHPDIVNVMIETGHAYRRYGLYSKAAEIYQDILTKGCAAKDRLCVLTGMAQSYIHLGEGARVNEIVNRILSDYRQEEKCAYSVLVIGEEYCIRADETRKKGNVEQSKDDFLHALDVWGKTAGEDGSLSSPQFCYFTADVFLQLDRFEEAILYYEEVLERWPTCNEAWQAQLMIAECYKGLREKGLLSSEDAALKMTEAYKKILDHYPNCPAVNIASNSLQILK